jgi:predicted ATPase
LPVLEALGRLCREPEGERLIGLLGRHAPTWLVQIPALIDDAELEALQRKVQGVTRERMLRELAEAVEVLTAETPLVLVLEDLQWSDYSTLDLIPYLAQRRGSARLLLLGTYRPADVIVSGNPLRAIRQELQVHGQCEEMSLRFLTATEVSQYLAARFAVGAHGRAPLQELGRVIYQSTDGNPLFMVNVVDYLVAQGMVGEVEGQWQLQARVEEVVGGVPEGLRQLIEKQVERLPAEEQQILEAASVAGGEFSAMAVAAGLEEKVEQTEEWCEGMVRRGHFLRAHGTETLSRRLRLHRRIGEGGEVVYGSRVGEIAAELAMHFERGQDYRRAVQYLGQAAQTALRRSAHREAIDHLTKGLELLKTLPDTPERAQQELMLQITLGAPLIATKGYAAPEVERVYTRARELYQQVGDSAQLFPVLWGLWAFYFVREELRKAHELGEQLFTLARSIQDPALLLEAHAVLGYTLYCLGEFISAREHVEQGVALYDPQQHCSLAVVYAGQDPKVACLSLAAWVLWMFGYPDQALKRVHEALTLAQELSHPYSLAFALCFAAQLHQYRREAQAAQERAEAAITLSTEQGFPFFLAMGTILRGWALAEQGQGEEGSAQIRQGLAAYRATGAERSRICYLALLAEAYGKAGQTKEGLAVLAEALAVVHRNGERWVESELYRLKGELTLAQSSV